MLSEETSYDANGNIVLLPMMRMSYDAQNRLVRVDTLDGTERYGYDHKNLRVWVQAADGSESFAFYLGTKNLATYSLKRKRVVLAGCTSGGAGFRMIVCLKRSLSWMG
jgi:YD repeat-containing protein